MATHIRLTRMGKKGAPYYRVIVVDSRKKRDGSYIDQLGYYQPLDRDGKIEIDLTKYNEWINKGAIPSLIVKNLVKKINKKTKN